MSDSNFDKELMEMWQEHTCPMPGDSELTRQLAGWVEAFDRRIFWRNAREYAAGAVVIAGLALQATFGDRLIPPLTGIAATLFALGYLWWRHRDTQPLDPSADASAYRAALLGRFDRQIELLRSARYWYVLPFWVFFLAVFVSGAIEVLTGPPGRISRGIGIAALSAAFLILTGLSLWLVWLNESYSMRKLKEARKQAEAIVTESLD